MGEVPSTQVTSAWVRRWVMENQESFLEEIQEVRSII